MAFITSLSVLEEYQGYGLAKRLLEEMVERCTQNGFKKITLEVYKANTRAQQLYLKMGFAFSTKDDEKYVMQKTDLNLLW